MGSYVRPTDLAAALDALAGPDGPRLILAGGTDVYPATVGRPVDQDVLDITAIVDLRDIRSTAVGWRIPALATWTDLLSADLPAAFDGLRAAARTIGGVQIQQRGTIAGNLCNASPAADGLPNLMALDAEVELASASGVRRLPVGEFVVGNRRTARRDDELVAAIDVPRPTLARTATAFEKLGSRAYLVISVASVAVRIDMADDGRIGAARVVVGACSEVPLHLAVLEARLVGQVASADLAGSIVAEDLADLTPIDDVRGTAAYRREAALVLVRRALRRCLP
jgi:CO/xanthine dehydrogenase FAD-binding subunit